MSTDHHPLANQVLDDAPALSTFPAASANAIPAFDASSPLFAGGYDEGGEVDLTAAFRAFAAEQTAAIRLLEEPRQLPTDDAGSIHDATPWFGPVPDDAAELDNEPVDRTAPAIFDADTSPVLDLVGAPAEPVAVTETVVGHETVAVAETVAIAETVAVTETVAVAEPVAEAVVGPETVVLAEPVVVDEPIGVVDVRDVSDLGIAISETDSQTVSDTATPSPTALNDGSQTVLMTNPVFDLPDADEFADDDGAAPFLVEPFGLATADAPLFSSTGEDVELLHELDSADDPFAAFGSMYATSPGADTSDDMFAYPDSTTPMPKVSLGPNTFAGDSESLFGADPFDVFASEGTTFEADHDPAPSLEHDAGFEVTGSAFDSRSGASSLSVEGEGSPFESGSSPFDAATTFESASPLEQPSPFATPSPFGVQTETPTETPVEAAPLASLDAAAIEGIASATAGSTPAGTAAATTGAGKEMGWLTSDETVAAPKKGRRGRTSDTAALSAPTVTTGSASTGPGVGARNRLLASVGIAAVVLAGGLFYAFSGDDSKPATGPQTGQNLSTVSTVAATGSATVPGPGPISTPGGAISFDRPVAWGQG